jgi:hypothetical protein
MKSTSDSTTIKSVGNKYYEVGLMQRPSGKYYIYTMKSGEHKQELSSEVLDYGFASEVFEKTVQRMEDN